MESFADHMKEYQKQLEKGVVQKAYRGLMDYVMDLRTYFERKHPDCFVSSIYYGYMDMTYFAFVPQSLKDRKLKAAIVFVHDTFRFEAWLAGSNKQVQANYWRLFKESGWNKHRIVPTTKGADSIVECVLVDQPDFSNLDVLTKQIESGVLQFVEDVEAFLSAH